MKNSKKAVKKFKKIYKIKGVPTSTDLIRVIKELGFITYGYSENENKLYETKTYNLSKVKHAFTYARENQKYVFYDDYLNEIDTERVLAHEIAHLYYNHLYRKTTILDSDVNKEWEANLFAAYLLKEPDYKSCIVKAILSSVLAILCFLCGMIYSERISSKHLDIPESNCVYITPSGTHYHKATCTHIINSKKVYIIGVNDTKYYLPCSLCNPDK